MSPYRGESRWAFLDRLDEAIGDGEEPDPRRGPLPTAEETAEDAERLRALLDLWAEQRRRCRCAP